MSEHGRIEAELGELAAAVQWPRTPDLAARVVARIEDREQRRAPRRRPWPLARGRGRVAAISAIVAALFAGALVEPVRSGLLDALGITGRERVIRVPGPPDTSRPMLDLGSRTTLSTAQRRLAFAIRLPRALGAPPEVRYSDAIAGGAVTLIYPGFALLEIQGGTSPVVEKQLGRNASARVVDIAGARGVFIRGPHEIAVLDRDGRFIPTTRSLVLGDVLVWQSGGVGYRLETRAGLRRALVVARSVL